MLVLQARYCGRAPPPGSAPPFGTVYGGWSPWTIQANRRSRRSSRGITDPVGPYSLRLPSVCNRDTLKVGFTRSWTYGFRALRRISWPLVMTHRWNRSRVRPALAQKGLISRAPPGRCLAGRIPFSCSRTTNAIRPDWPGLRLCLSLPARPSRRESCHDFVDFARQLAEPMRKKRASAMSPRRCSGASPRCAAAAKLIVIVAGPPIPDVIQGAARAGTHRAQGAAGWVAGAGKSVKIAPANFMIASGDRTLG